MKRFLPPGFTETERRLVRPDRPMTTRIETRYGTQGGASVLSAVTVEWAGRLGHPSSYALLGGWRSSRPDVHVDLTDALFKGSLAGSADEVRWGLPPEFAAPVLDLLDAQPQPIRVGDAAHGVVGSSIQTFRCVALMLCHMLAVDVPRDDDDVWILFDRCWNEALRSE